MDPTHSCSANLATRLFSRKGTTGRDSNKRNHAATDSSACGAVKDDWPKTLEAQRHFGEAVSLFGVRGGSVSRAHCGPVFENRKPFGERESIEIRSLDRVVTVQLNGKKMNEGHNVEPLEGSSCLQSEGWPAFYRNPQVKKLD